MAVLAPTGRDAHMAELVLGRAGFAVVACPDMSALCRLLAGAQAAAVGALLVAEEALGDAARAALASVLAAQPSWSDVPVVVLTGEGELSRASPRGIEALAAVGNVTLLERPVRVATLVTTLRAALRARRRQLDLREHLAERAAAERALRESESRLRDAVLSSPYPMMLHAEDGEVVQLSRAWTARSGHPAHALRTVGDWVALALPEGDAAGWLRAGALPDAAAPDARWRVRTAAGEDRSWDVRTVPLAPLPDGRRLALTAAVDVTETRQLLERERAARGEAEEANRSKSAFLAMMSHELRTPLNAIAGYAQLLALGVRGPVNAEQVADLERIDRSQRHLLSLINDILNFAKIEAGRVDVVLQPVRVRDALAGVEPLVAPLLEAKALRYVDDSATCDALVLADPEKLRQILLNLLSNAIKFTAGGRTITVRCTADAATAAIEVRDTGIGIPADKLEEIFEPFVQVERHFASTHEGTGLGLAISRELARRMGGDIAVESTLGAGTAFTLTVPLAPGAAHRPSQ